MKRKALYTKENTKRLIADGLDWNFHDVKTQEHLHTLHPYPAKFIPQIPRKAIEQWSRPGDLVYDPFCGCGTTLLEASLLGRPSIGTDNNDVAVLVTKAKIFRYKAADCARLLAFTAKVSEVLPTARPRPDLLPDNKNFRYWFHPAVLDKLSALKGLIKETPGPMRTLLMAVYSSIIVKVSYQDSDTRYARVGKVVDPTDVERAFNSKLTKVVKSIPEAIRSERAEAKVFKADARHIPFIEDNSVSLIVTSPPYLNAYDYHKYHRQRLHLIDGSIEFARDIEIGSHDEFTRPNAAPGAYFDDMASCFSEWARVLQRRGRCVVLIGDAIVNKKPVRVADGYIDIAARVGLRLEGRWVRELMATKRSFNVRNSRISHEHVLLFRKP